MVSGKKTLGQASESHSGLINTQLPTVLSGKKRGFKNTVKITPYLAQNPPFSAGVFISKERVQVSNTSLRSLLIAGEYRGEDYLWWSRVAAHGGAGIEEMRIEG